MKKCTDQYGNISSDLRKGSIVEDNLAVFTVGEVHFNNGFVEMDGSKQYIIKDYKNPMAKCVEKGHYAVQAATLHFHNQVEAND